MAGVTFICRLRGMTLFVSHSLSIVGSLTPNFTFRIYNSKPITLPISATNFKPKGGTLMRWFRLFVLTCIGAVVFMAPRLNAFQTKDGFKGSVVKVLDGSKVNEKERMVHLRGPGKERVIVCLCERLDKTPMSEWSPKFEILQVNPKEAGASSGAGMGVNELFTQKLFPSGLKPYQMVVSIHLRGEMKSAVVQLFFERWGLKKQWAATFEGLPIPRNEKVIRVEQKVSTRNSLTASIEKIGLVEKPVRALAVVVSISSSKGVFFPAVNTKDMGQASDNKNRVLKSLMVQLGDTLRQSEPALTGIPVTIYLSPPQTDAKTFRLVFPVYEKALLAKSRTFSLQKVTFDAEKRPTFPTKGGEH
jgi:hypothetical protein